MRQGISKYKILRNSFIAFVLIIAILITGFLIWASDYYHAEDNALAVFNGGDAAMEVRDNLTILSPAYPSDTGFIFYPGGKVESAAYLPILEKIKQKCGITCILVKMPLNLAVFDSNAAQNIMTQFPNIKNWYIGGHSLGGAMASSFASKNPGKVKGLILMGAYIYGDYPPDKALTIYGTFNSNLEKNIHYTENIVVIEGGNHAQFGNYGKQKGDPDATITAETQQNIAVDAIASFISKRQQD